MTQNIDQEDEAMAIDDRPNPAVIAHNQPESPLNKLFNKVAAA